MRGGTLREAHSEDHFSYDECLHILHQGLSALVYLHERPNPIAHRDIKPENILVEHRDPDRNILRIKLSDFGLSKTGDLESFCGSKTYFPPEVRDDGASYTEAVDIWSLGVVILEFAYGLPRPGRGIGMRWCKKVVKEANNRKLGGLIEILQRMLVIEANARFSAAACLHETSRLLASSQDRFATPTLASYAAGHGATTAHQGGEERETLRISPHEVCPRKYSLS